jgi:hypothetical protein
VEAGTVVSGVVPSSLYSTSWECSSVSVVSCFRRLSPSSEGNWTGDAPG